MRNPLTPRGTFWAGVILGTALAGLVAYGLFTLATQRNGGKLPPMKWKIERGMKLERGAVTEFVMIMSAYKIGEAK